MRSVYGAAQYDQLDETARDKLMKLFGYLYDFPLRTRDGSEPRYSMPCPTRLGCLIDKYTAYPMTRYGIDAEQFWNHVRYVFPDEVREELDGNEAVAQGMVMSAAASWITFLLAVTGLILSVIARSLPQLVVFGSAPPTAVLLLLLTASAFGVLVFSALAREAHRDFGRHYQAAFDVHSTDLRAFLERTEAPFPELVRTRASGFALWAHHLQKSTAATDTETADPRSVDADGANDAL